MVFRFSNPRQFVKISRWCLGVGFVLMVLGLSVGYAHVWKLSEDAVQGPVFKILYIHVPAAWLAMGLYATLALSSFVYLIWRHVLAFFLAEACAWVGSIFTLVCLVTGMFWGKTTWGTWWVWDARLTSVLILFFLYVGYLVFIRLFSHWGQAAHNGSLLALFGAINLPIIKWSVDWWHTLHQPASVTKLAAPSMAPEFLWPLMGVFAGWCGYAMICVIWVVLGFLNQHQAKVKEWSNGR